MPELTPRQGAFVREYLVDLNASAAAVRAGYSAATANRIGPRLLSNVGVAAAIAEAQAERSKRTEVTQDRVILELARIAFGDSHRVMSWGPEGVKLRPSAELTDDEAAIVAEASQTVTEAGGTIRLKTVDKLGALKLLGTHLGMFVERREVNSTLALPAEWGRIQGAIVAALDGHPGARVAVMAALEMAAVPGGPADG